MVEVSVFASLDFLHIQCLYEAFSLGVVVRQPGRLTRPESPYRSGRKPKTPPGEPNVKAQPNFTDPENRIIKAKDGFI